MAELATETILARHPFFQDIDAHILSEIAATATTSRFEAGRLIFHQGEPADKLYLITCGKVALEVFAPARGPILLLTLGAEDVLGWSWLFPPYRWHLDARALEPTEAIAIDGAALRASCEANHELGYHLLKHSVSVIEQRLQAALLQVVDLYHA